MSAFEGVSFRFARIEDERLVALAPEHWRRKSARMRFERERLQELVAGGLLAEMVLQGGGGRIESVAESPTGKPYFPGSHIHFSISHSDEIVMCAIGNRPIGCDVERIVPLDEVVRKEVASIREWTLKEASFKCGVEPVESVVVQAPDGYSAAIAWQVGVLLSRGIYGIITPT